MAAIAPVDVASVLVVAAWAAAAGLLARRHRWAAALAPALAAITGATALAADAWGPRPVVVGAALGVLPAIALLVLAGLPDGTVRRSSHVTTAAALGLVGAVTGALSTVGRDEPNWWVQGGLWVVGMAVGLRIAHGQYVRAPAAERRRSRWVGAALIVVCDVALVLLALRLMVDWPPHAVAVWLAASTAAPAALVAAVLGTSTSRVDGVVVHIVSVAGLTAVVIGAYVAVVAVIGRALDGDERTLLVLSMSAAAVAAFAYPLVRNRLIAATNQLMFGETTSPDDALRTWGSRLTRAIPLDELLLQLAETLRKSMQLRAAEIYTGTDGHYEWSAGVPHRRPAPVVVGETERAIISRAGVSGGTWLDVWLPGVAPGASADTRVAPIVHSGELLGLIVVTKPEGSDGFDGDDDPVLTDLARQIGLALHNTQLDSALQASLEELRTTNVALQESRKRIVSAGDAERRRLERNLHDGAQQHLVAMAVKLRMIEELVEDDPKEALAAIDGLQADLKETVVELRALAHGIFPPLLSSGGLTQALPAAATRSPLITTVEADGVRRHPPEVEAAVYFCCLEAMQNAAKHAGDTAEVIVRVHEDGGRLCFEVRDDGAGFDVAEHAEHGHGFVNMADRLGTLGGVLHVDSSRGVGTAVRGEIPLSAAPESVS